MTLIPINARSMDDIKCNEEEHFYLNINMNFDGISQFNMEESQWSHLKPRYGFDRASRKFIDFPKRFILMQYEKLKAQLNLKLESSFKL